LPHPVDRGTVHIVVCPGEDDRGYDEAAVVAEHAKRIGLDLIFRQGSGGILTGMDGRFIKRVPEVVARASPLDAPLNRFPIQQPNGRYMTVCGAPTTIHGDTVCTVGEHHLASDHLSI